MVRFRAVGEPYRGAAGNRNQPYVAVRAVFFEIGNGNGIGDPFFGVNLNPGHQIHLEEWLNSPIYKDSDLKLKSGMALQVDVIPATGTEYFTTNMEDGIALANEELRAKFMVKYPEAWERIQARREFVTDQVGIKIKTEILPFSNIPCYLPPYLLAPGKAMQIIKP